MRDLSIDTITPAFLDYCSAQTDPRFMFVLKSLIEHLHAFAKETELTHDEWARGLKFLYDAGQISTPERDEFILMSDVTGLSSLVDMLGSQHEGTSSSVLGPFHVTGAPTAGYGADLKQDNEGATVLVTGCVRSPEGEPIPGAHLEMWQTADNGLYSNQDPHQPDYNLRLSMRVGDDGRYAFTTVRPAPYKIPDDGPVGALLRATGREAWRPSHLHFIVTAPGKQRLVTEVFPSDDPYLDQDAVFGVRGDLIMHYEEQRDLSALPDGLAVGQAVTLPWYRVDFDFVLVDAR